MLDVCLRQQRDARTASKQPRSSALASTASVLQALQATSTSQRVLDDKKSLALNCTCAVFDVAARHTYGSLQPQSSTYSSKDKPRTAQHVSHHASTKTTSPALRHPARRPGARARADATETVFTITCSNVRPTKSKSVRLRAQARQGLRRRPPRRHGHGPGWEDRGARCGRSQRE